MKSCVSRLFCVLLASDNHEHTLKKNSIKYLVSIFLFRYVCQQVNQMNLASCTNFVRRFSFIFIFWLTTANGFEPPAALLRKRLSPLAYPRNLLENTSREFREKLEVNEPFPMDLEKNLKS